MRGGGGGKGGRRRNGGWGGRWGGEGEGGRERRGGLIFLLGCGVTNAKSYVKFSCNFNLIISSSLSIILYF